MVIKSKMKTPSLKDVDTYNAEVVANASRFAASLFLGRGKYANAEANTKEEIEALAAKLSADHPHINGKPVIVCFDNDGNQSMISGKPYKEHKKPKTPKQAVADAVNKAIEAGAPVIVNQPATEPDLANALKAKKAKAGKKDADHPLVANLKKAMTSAKPAKAAKAKPAKAAKAKAAPKGKAKPKAAGNGSTRPRGAKWEAARKLLTAKGGTARAPLFEALKWRSMDQNLLAKGTGLVITKLESGNYAGKEA